MGIPVVIELATELWSKDSRFVPPCVMDYYAHDDPNRWTFRESFNQCEHPQELSAWDCWLKEDQQALLEATLGKLIVVLSSFGRIDLQIQNETVSVFNKEKQEVRRFRSQKTMLRNILQATHRAFDLNWLPRFQSVDGKWYYSEAEAVEADATNTQELLYKKSVLEASIRARTALTNDPFGFPDSTGVPMEVLMERLSKDNNKDRNEIADIDSKLSDRPRPGLFRHGLQQNVDEPKFEISALPEEHWIIKRWMDLWEDDAGIIPVGVEGPREFRCGLEGELLESFWVFYDKKMKFDDYSGWTQLSLEKLYMAQLGAAVGRVSRIEGFTLKILGNRVVGIFQNGETFMSGIPAGGDYMTLLGNLAELMEWVLPRLPERVTNSENGTLKLELGFSLLA